jgi:hypothetical protein
MKVRESDKTKEENTCLLALPFADHSGERMRPSNTGEGKLCACHVSSADS